MADTCNGQPILMAIRPDQSEEKGHSSETVNGQDNGYTNGYTNGSGTLKAQPRILTVSQVPYPPFQQLANPGPLGLLGFALTTFVLGLYKCGAGLPGSNPRGTVGPDQAIFGLALFMGGLAQLIAGIMEFRVGNTFGTTVHCSYSAFWMSYAMFSIPGLGIHAAYDGDERAFTFAVGIYLIGWCLLTCLFLAAALRTNITIIVVFSLLALAFLFLAVADFIATSHPGPAIRVNQVGGAVSVACSIAAFYAGAAGLMRPETTFIRFPLGTIPHSDSFSV
ncbi:hypothetical protein FQN57_005686 [Myotisia sp. PD_48]|nr:hypothetical protein FQN57_005686 [Myotisia sp. PD_48]